MPHVTTPALHALGSTPGGAMAGALGRAPRLLWIGSPFFSQALSACGFEVHAHNFEDVRVFSWPELVQLAGGPPDVLVVADKSRPPFVLGQERFPCLTVFYAVDTHIHSWLASYAQSFDLCLVSLRDHLPHFLSHRLEARQLVWSPPYALSSLFAEHPVIPFGQRTWPCLFVGTVDAQKTPRRAAFLAALTARLPELHVTQGAYADLYPQAEVVLNISELGDLNFRVFEALGCGACLLTPEIGHGLTQLFTPGQDLELYPELDVDGAAQAIRHLLADASLRARMAEAGHAALRASHTDAHRAQSLTAALHALPADTVAQRLAEADSIQRIWLRQIYLLLAESIPDSRLRTAYLKASKKTL